MIDIQFYQLTVTPLERALPKLLEKALASGQRAVVYCGSEERAEQLNQLLWTYDPNSFLPHGTARDGNAQQQPVYLAAGQENINEATVAVAVDDNLVEPSSSLMRILDLYHAENPQSMRSAVERQAYYSAAGHRVACLVQNERGEWKPEQMVILPV